MIDYPKGGVERTYAILRSFSFPHCNASMEFKQADVGLHKSLLEGFHDCLSTSLCLTLTYYSTLIKHLETSDSSAA